MEDYKIINSLIKPPDFGVGKPQGKAEKFEKEGVQSFKEVLGGKLSETAPISFSNHALQRLKVRNIDIGGEDMKKIETGVSIARGKGSRESLVVTDKLALIVSLKNNTVVTAMERSQLKENIFTNIDSAVFV